MHRCTYHDVPYIPTYVEREPIADERLVFILQGRDPIADKIGKDSSWSKNQLCSICLYTLNVVQQVNQSLLH